MKFDFDESAPVLEIKDLNLSYFTRAGEIPAAIDFSLTVNKGESIGLVGESGCGKSTVAMAIMQYMGGNGAIRSGSIKFKGVEMNEMTPEQLQHLRGSEISMIYQEPFASLNPSLLLGSQLKEVLTTHEGISDQEAHERAVALLENVKLPDPERVMESYPHQISFLDHFARIHDEHAVADFQYQAKVVGDVNLRGPKLLADVGDQLCDAGLHGHVERRGRLVQQQQRGPGQQRHGDRSGSWNRTRIRSPAASSSAW